MNCRGSRKGFASGARRTAASPRSSKTWSRRPRITPGPKVSVWTLEATCTAGASAVRRSSATSGSSAGLQACCASKHVLNAHLHRAVAGARCDEPEIRERRIVHRVAEPRAIEHVERLEPQVEVLLADRERFSERRVEFPEARIAQEV